MENNATPQPEQQTIHLASGPVELEDQQGTLAGMADVSLQIVPTPKVVIDATFDVGPGRTFELVFKGRDSLVVSLPDLGVRTQAIILSATTLEASKVQLTPTGERIEVGPTGELAYVDFSLLNFPDFLARKHSAEEGERFFRDVDIAADSWRIRIASVPHIAAAVSLANRHRGYAITHNGRIHREDHQQISIDDARDLLDVLHYFLSFVRGFWTAPLLPTGYDSAGGKVWAQWTVNHSSSWRGVDSWFDRHRGNLVAEIFPGFYARWKIDIWKSALKRSVYWYIGSNLGAVGVEGGIVLSQAALELLAWTYFLDDRAMISKDGFKNLKAPDKIRLLLSTLDIPLGLPPELVNLTQYAKARNMHDGPGALVAFRNGTIHAGDKPLMTDSHPSERIEAWHLGQWYIELVLLRLCGHDGEYRNRLRSHKWVGDVDTVPWAT